jgi:AraC family transcriptional regulator
LTEHCYCTLADEKSVVDVAFDVGYANPSHFAQLFRRETGLSPSYYRRQR